MVFLYLRGRPLWFRRMNSPALFAELLAYAGDALKDHDVRLPENLAVRSFSWAGEGVGPEPPVEEFV